MRRDAVTPELAAAVITRDRTNLVRWYAERGVYHLPRPLIVCVAPMVDNLAIGRCAGRARIEHVKREPRMGKRAEATMGTLLTLCSAHTEDGMKAGVVWATTKINRQRMREYLREDPT